jgi:hypothetical protein
VPVPGIENARQLGVGAFHACALLADRTVRCWGYNGNGRLGSRGDSSARPRAVEGLTDVVQLAVTDLGGCALRGDGGVWCWGDSEDFTQPAAVPRASRDMVPPERIAELADVVEIRAAKSIPSYLCARTRDGSVWCGGETYLAPFTTSSPRFHRVAGLASAIGLALGDRHQCALLADRTVACWGSNTEGQTGQPEAHVSTPTTVAGLTGARGKLVAGWKQTCLLGAAGLSCWGGFRPSPVAVTSKRVPGKITEVALSENACVTAEHGRWTCFRDSWLDGWQGSQTGPRGWVPEHPAPSDPLELALGRAAGCAILRDRSVACWSYDCKPVAIEGAEGAQTIAMSPRGDGCVQLGAGRVKCWTGHHNEDASQLLVSAVQRAPELDGARSIALYLGGGCALMESGALSCWSGDIPNKEHPAKQVLDHVTQVTAGLAHVCVVSADDVYCWGSNTEGQVGTGTPTLRPIEDPTRIALAPR